MRFCSEPKAGWDSGSSICCMSSRRSPRSFWAWHNAAQFSPRAWHQALSAPPTKGKGTATAAKSPPREPSSWLKGLLLLAIEICQLVAHHFSSLENLAFLKKMQSGLLTLYKGFVHLDQRTVITICMFQGPTQGSFFCREWRMGEPRSSWRRREEGHLGE